MQTDRRLGSGAARRMAARKAARGSTHAAARRRTGGSVGSGAEEAAAQAEQQDGAIVPLADRQWHSLDSAVRVRFHIIRNACIQTVGNYQSCMVSKLRIIWKQTVETAVFASGSWC